MKPTWKKTYKFAGSYVEPKEEFIPMPNMKVSFEQKEACNIIVKLLFPEEFFKAKRLKIKQEQACINLANN